ncbi:MAG: hypothetical protein A3C12_01015 [Candidatus Sungbacteria bacterium RIFCSPHIGHO2_02_FULL_49_20]|uniref:SpoVT-AbrB domain-containing protein n=1 Tax=Candidatus Sungbacteria bacterium RIFCSPHIGHO2_02_FULL_49_20 TaxID=1802272 RepID=A0A1G2KRM1_9BACT|nr:MAG: hypothetical protein A3C12_01015 [Candidatus Sungbacteria bacterium RIFCSPHIGHO2_02_FULL_49_20]
MAGRFHSFDIKRVPAYLGLGNSYFSYFLTLGHTFMTKIKKLPIGPKPVFYGSTTLGARGQVVIPIKARRDFKLKDGEELLVSGVHRRFLMVMKLDELKGVVSELSGHMKVFQQMISKSKSKKS